MPVFTRRPIALAVCCLFVHAQMARAANDFQRPLTPAGSLEAHAKSTILDTQPLQLRPAKRLLSVTKKQAPSVEPLPTFIVADQLEGRSDDVVEAEGKVELRQKDSLLLADRLKYFPLDDLVEATDNVNLTQSAGLNNVSEMSGSFLRLKVSDRIGHFDHVDYHVRSEIKVGEVQSLNSLAPSVQKSGDALLTNAPMMLNVPLSYGLQDALPRSRPRDVYGKAERVDFEGDNRLRLSDAEYSTCKPGDKAWYLKAKELYLDYDDEVGKLKDATVYFKDAPIAYLPLGSFSLNRKPHSGFLPVSFRASTRSGLDITVPYYWNIAPNYDLTLYPRMMSKRGFQLGAETRYLTSNVTGHARLEYMPNDNKTSQSRYAYSVVHNQNLGRDLTMNLNWNGVSDDSYWSDFSSRLLETSQIQLPRMAQLSYSPSESWWSASALWLRYQTLQTDPANRVARPYFIEPQINLVAGKPDIAGLDMSLQAQYTRFSDPNRDEGRRFVFYPQIAMPYFHPAFSIQPKFGVHVTNYGLTRRTTSGPESLTRTLPIFSVDSTMSLERQVQWQGRDFIQTLEPRLYYLYIPFRDQRKIPVFDSGVSDFNFAQIFGENRYTGHDRINNANHLTAALTSRMIDAGTGGELFRAMVGQRYYFAKQRVFVPGETTLPEDFSNFLAAFSGLVAKKTYVDSAWEYDYHRSRTQRFSLGARYQPDNAKVLSGSYRFARDGLGDKQVDQVDLAFQWPVSKGWYAVGRYNYSMRDKRPLEAIAGLEYNASCWAARFVVQRLTAVGGSPNTTFFFQLELNDFASVGSSPLQLLRRSVPGYGKVNELPTTGSLITSE